MANPKPLLLEGLVEPESNPQPGSGRDVQRLEDENRSLRRDLEDVTAERDRLAHTVKNLQTTLNPMHRALSALFGEIELVVGEPESSASNGTPSAAVSRDPRWEHFKKQFPGVPATIIDALLIHGTVKLTNLASLLGKHYDTVKAAAAKLRSAGAAVLTSEGLSLKR